MAKQKEEKTNVMRILEQKGIPFTPHTYPHEEGVAVDGASVARSLGQDPECVFKTLAARGASKAIYVFDIPVEDTLDLKKAAKAVGEKSIAMLHQKELLPLTGYVHGGCSPVGMKKQYPTVFHETAEINSACGKVLPPTKRLYAPSGAPARCAGRKRRPAHCPRSSMI